jgi:polysaccharide biosynthesis transport protein
MAPDNFPMKTGRGGDSLPAARPSDRAVNRRMQAANESHAVMVSPVDGGDSGDSDGIDLLTYWRMLLKRRWLIAGVVAVVVAIALIKTLLTPPTYRATVVMQIEAETMQIMQVQGMAPMGADREFNKTQYELLKSRSLAERVVGDLHLADGSIFERLEPPSWGARLRGLLSRGSSATEQPVSTEGMSGDSPAGAGDDAKTKLSRATAQVQNGVTVNPIRDSHLVQVSYDSMSPSFAARVANALADGFIASSMDRQFGASSYAKKYLEDQLAQLKSRLEDSERALVAFAQKENIVPSVDGTSLVGRNLVDLNSSLAQAQQQRIRAEARWQAASGASANTLPADLFVDAPVRILQQQRAQLQGQYQQKLQVFKPDYPEMQALKRQIEESSRQIDAELKNMRASVKAEYESALSQEKLLDEQLDSLRSQTLETDRRSIQYNIFKRDVDTNRQLYNALLQRYKEVGMAGGAKPSNISIIDRAEVPKSRFAPSLSRNLMLGLMLGSLLGVMIAFLLEFIDDTLKSPQDIEQQLKLAVLGIIPKLARQTPREALEDPRSAFSES